MNKPLTLLIASIVFCLCTVSFATYSYFAYLQAKAISKQQNQFTTPTVTPTEALTAAPEITQLVDAFQLGGSSKSLFAVNDGGYGVVLSAQIDGKIVMARFNPDFYANNINWTTVATDADTNGFHISSQWHIFAHNFHWIAFSTTTNKASYLLKLDKDFKRIGKYPIATDSSLVNTDNMFIVEEPNGVAVAHYELDKGEKIFRFDINGNQTGTALVEDGDYIHTNASSAIHTATGYEIYATQSNDNSKPSGIKLIKTDSNWQPLVATSLLSEADANFSMPTIAILDKNHKMLTVKKVKLGNSAGQIIQYILDQDNLIVSSKIISEGPSDRPHTLIANGLLLTMFDQDFKTYIHIDQVITANNFDSGVYYRRPSVNGQSGKIFSTSNEFNSSEAIYDSGYDIKNNLIFYTDNKSSIFTLTKKGDRQEYKIDGLYYITSPSARFDGTKVAVQASEVDNGNNPATNSLNIYVVDLATRQFQKISKLSVDQKAPVWYKRSDRIAYSSFSPTGENDIHVYSLDQAGEVLKISGAGALNLAISKDDKYLLQSDNLKMFDATTGDLLFDIKADVISQLEAAGYALDSRYPGFLIRGTFPLSADFAPDGSRIVIEGAVSKNGTFGAIIAQVDFDASHFKLLSDLIDINPEFAESNSNSQIDVLWH